MSSRSSGKAGTLVAPATSTRISAHPPSPRDSGAQRNGENHRGRHQTPASSQPIRSPAQEPWRPGTVYLLPADTFEQDAIDDDPDGSFESAERASLEPVIPVAKLTVEPDDFPFRQQIRRHDPDVVMARAKADPDGFPWLDGV